MSTFDVLNAAARSGDKNTEKKATPARDELHEKLKAGLLPAFGILEGASQRSEIPATAWRTLSPFSYHEFLPAWVRGKGRGMATLTEQIVEAIGRLRKELGRPITYREGLDGPDRKGVVVRSEDAVLILSAAASYLEMLGEPRG